MALQSKKSRRGQLHLWFEFLRLAHKIPEFSDNLHNVSPYYAAWGDVKNQDFNRWWNEHHRLFGNTEVRSIRELTPCPGIVHLAVPLDIPISELRKQFSEIISREKTAAQQTYIEPTQLSTFHFEPQAFGLTEGAQPREKTLWETHTVVAAWIKFGRPTVNDGFCFRLLEYAKSIGADVPYGFNMPAQKDRHGTIRFSDDQIRHVRKHQKRGYEICRSVSLGRFPGRIRLK